MSNCTIENKPGATATARDEKEVFERPRFGAHKDDQGHTVKVMLPGVAKADVTVALDQRVLTVTGRRSKVATPEGWRLTHQELEKPDYRLRLELGDDIEDAKIDAAVEAGVLTLKFPVKEAAKPREISVG